MPEQSDSQLLYHAKAGDLSAFGELWLRYHQLGIDYCRSLGGTDAEDLVSESFLRILLATKSTFGPTESFKGYLFATIRNDVSKKSKTSSIRELAIESINDERDFSLPSSLNESQKQQVGEVLSKLKPRWQKVLYLRHVQQLRVKEIASEIRISQNSASALISRAEKAFVSTWFEFEIAAIGLGPACRTHLLEVATRSREQQLTSRQVIHFTNEKLPCVTCFDYTNQFSKSAVSSLFLTASSIIGLSSIGVFASQSKALRSPSSLSKKQSTFSGTSLAVGTVVVGAIAAIAISTLVNPLQGDGNLESKPDSRTQNFSLSKEPVTQQGSTPSPTQTVEPTVAPEVRESASPDQNSPIPEVVTPEESIVLRFMNFSSSQAADVTRTPLLPSCNNSLFDSFALNVTTWRGGLPRLSASGIATNMTNRKIQLHESNNPIHPWSLSLSDGEGKELRFISGDWVTEPGGGWPVGSQVASDLGDLYALSPEGVLFVQYPDGYGTYLSFRSPLSPGQHISYVPDQNNNDCANGLAVSKPRQFIESYIQQ